MPDALAELRRLVKRGTAPEVQALLPAHADLVERLIARHGNLAAARQAAGFGRREKTVMDRGKVTDAFRALADRGVQLTARRLRALGEERLIEAAYDVFGSLTAAREAAGVAVPEKRTPRLLSRDDVLAEIRERADEHSSVNRGDLDPAVIRAARQHFGRVPAAIKEAGLIHRNAHRRWTPDLVRRELAERAARGEEVSHGALLAGGRKDLASAVVRHLGGFPGARPRRAGRPRAPTRRPPGPDRIIARTTARLSGMVSRFVDQYVAVSRRGGFSRSPRRGAASIDGLVIDPSALREALDRVARRRRLSAREVHVLAAMVFGVPRSRIGEALGLSENAVKTYVGKLLGKLGHKNLDDAVWWIRSQVRLTRRSGG